MRAAKVICQSLCFISLFLATLFGASLVDDITEAQQAAFTALRVCILGAALFGVISAFLDDAIDNRTDKQERKHEALYAPQEANEITHCVHLDRVYHVICVDRDNGIVYATSPQFDGIEYKFPLADVVLF